MFQRLWRRGKEKVQSIRELTRIYANKKTKDGQPQGLPLQPAQKLKSYKKKVQSTKRNRVFKKKLGFFALNLNISELEMFGRGAPAPTIAVVRSFYMNESIFITRFLDMSQNQT